ncbi:hypothetical protein N7509_003687, partial [Penicillium cosmopolitanum]
GASPELIRSTASQRLDLIPHSTSTVSEETSPRRSSTTARPPSPTDSLAEDDYYTAPPPPHLLSEASPSSSVGPPPFSSLFFAPSDSDFNRLELTESSASASLPAFAPPPVEESLDPAPSSSVVADTKASFSDPKGDTGKSSDDGEPPPPYTEGYSPLESFNYVMAAAGGASSIITQVQQTGDRRSTPLVISAEMSTSPLTFDELLTLPEFVLLSLFPNGLLPDGHIGGFHEGDIYPVDYDPLSLQYMLDFFRTVAQSIPSTAPSESTSPDLEMSDTMQNSARDMLQDRAGIIVLREDLDFYIGHEEMLEVKRAAGRALLRQDGIFSGLRKSEEIGSTEQHLIEMLTAGGFDREDQWGHRAPEPNKAVICSLALAKLRTDIRGDLSNNNAVGMAQKLLLFWRKPARRCWWEGIDLDDVEGVEGQVKVWIRRVWTLEMSVIGLR